MVVCSREFETTEESGTDAPRGRTGPRVLVRVRPPAGAEVGKNPAVEVVSHVKLRVARNDQTPLTLRFDRTFGPECGQADVFESVRELVAAAPEGRSGSILTYGQTGSGKTHTMIGEMFVEPGRKLSTGAQKGVIARGMEYLFQLVRSQPQAPKNCRATFWRVYVTFMEIYNERVYDLLSENQSSTPGRGHGPRSDMAFNRKVPDATEHRLDVRENPDGSVSVPGVTVVAVHSSDQAMEVLKIGILNRKCGDNGVNRMSSRSHAIFQVLLEKRTSDGKEGLLTQATKLNFVDLAGSEKLQADDSVSSAVKKELTSINHSLSSLSNCIAALVDQKRTHVPYRNSRLTRLLQDSLRGQSLIAMCICISPAFSALEETLSSLKFADRAKRAILDRQQPPTPARGADKQVAELTSQVQELKDMLKSEREQRLKLESLLLEREACRKEGKHAQDVHAKGATVKTDENEGGAASSVVVECSSGASSRVSRGMEEPAYHDEQAASSASTAAELCTAVVDGPPEATKVNSSDDVSGIAELLAMASDVEHEEVEKERIEQRRLSVGSVELFDEPRLQQTEQRRRSAELLDDPRFQRTEQPRLSLGSIEFFSAEPIQEDEEAEQPCLSEQRRPSAGSADSVSETVSREAEICSLGIGGDEYNDVQIDLACVGQDAEVSAATVESLAAWAGDAPGDREASCSEADWSSKAAKSNGTHTNACISDISAQLSALADQNVEVLARLEALESRSVASHGCQSGDDLPIPGGRWRRAAMHRLQEASSDPSLSASELRQLIGEAFAPKTKPAGSSVDKSPLDDEHSESSEHSDSALPSRNGSREERIAQMETVHATMRGRSPTIHEASPWAPVIYNMASTDSISAVPRAPDVAAASTGSAASVAVHSPLMSSDAAMSSPGSLLGSSSLVATALSPSTSCACDSPGRTLESPIDTESPSVRGKADRGAGERKSSGLTNASLTELRRLGSPKRSPSSGDARQPSPHWGEACCARDSSQETERALRTAHSALSQTSQLTQMRLTALEKRADEASLHGAVANGPKSRGPAKTPRLEKSGSADSGRGKPPRLEQSGSCDSNHLSARPKATGKSNATPPRFRTDRGALGSSSSAPPAKDSPNSWPARDGNGRSQHHGSSSHGRTNESRTKQGGRPSCTPLPDKALRSSAAAHAPADIHGAHARQRGGLPTGVAANQLQRQKEMLRRGRDDRARLRNERQRSPGSQSPSASPNHEVWSCLGGNVTETRSGSARRASDGQAGVNVGRGRSGTDAPASSNARVSEVVSTCWEEFERALQRASVATP